MVINMMCIVNLPPRHLGREHHISALFNFRCSRLPIEREHIQQCKALTIGQCVFHEACKISLCYDLHNIYIIFTSEAN